MCKRAVANTLATIVILTAAPLSLAAQPNATGALPAPAAEAVQPVAALPVAAPVPAPTTESAPERTEADPLARQDRSRVLSYIILQSLQGVGPYSGGR